MLAGVPLIKFGFRDSKGILKHCKTFSTNEIPNLSSNQGANWVRNVNYMFVCII